MRQALEVYYASCETADGWFNVPGTSFRAYGNLLDELIRPIVGYGHAAEASDVAYFRTFVSPGAVVLDIGANVGLFALRIVDRCLPSGAIHLFEPNPTLYGFLLRTLERNPGLPLSVHPLAIAGVSGQATFHVTMPDATAHGALDRHEWGVSRGIFPAQSGIVVTTRTVDDVAEELRLDRIDAIKIDVEGAEAAVVAGMGRSVRKYRPGVVMCETTKRSDAYEALAGEYAEITVVSESGTTVRSDVLPSDYWGNFFFSQHSGSK